MKRAFVTYLGTPDFLPGVLVLNQSLKENGNHTDLVILVTPDISTDIISFLENNSFNIKLIDSIRNPNNTEEIPDSRFKYNYSKLRIFSLVEYEKIVYLDADLLVCECIEYLFDRPHMSGVVAGSVLNENKDWRKFNAGVLVIEPSMILFEKMELAIEILPSITKGDQGFLHSYYSDWENQPILHLEHCFNVPALYLDQYCATGFFTFAYHDKQLSSKNIAVIHFWGRNKPWHYESSRGNEKGLTKYQQAINLWWNYYDSILSED